MCSVLGIFRTETSELRVRALGRRMRPIPAHHRLAIVDERGAQPLCSSDRSRVLAVNAESDHRRASRLAPCGGVVHDVHESSW